MVDLAALIIPVKVNSEVVISFPIIVYGVMLPKDSHEVLRMISTDIFYSKFVNVKREADWASGVCP